MAVLKMSGQDARRAVSGDLEGYEHVNEKLIDTNRWENVYSTVIQDGGGTLWELHWSRGATEQQDHSSFEDGEQTFYQVEPVERIIIEYKRVKGDINLVKEQDGQEEKEGQQGGEEESTDGGFF